MFDNRTMSSWLVILGVACAATIAAVFMLLLGKSTGRAFEGFDGEGTDANSNADSQTTVTSTDQDGQRSIEITIPLLGKVQQFPTSYTYQPDPKLELELASRDELAGCDGVKKIIEDRVNNPMYQGLCPDHRCPAVTLPAGAPSEFTADKTVFVYDEDGENERRVRFMGDKISEQIDSVDRTFNYPVVDERCGFVRDKLGPDADKHIFFNDNRLLSHPYSGQPEVCYVPPHVGNVSYDPEGCSPANNRLYHPDFDDVVDRDGIKMSLNHRADGDDTYRPMCEIRFKKTATKERVGEYLQYLYNKEPEREYWQQSTSWLFNQHFEDTKTMAAYMEQLLLQQNEIMTLTSDLADSRAQNRIYNETLLRYDKPSEYMHDYLFMEALPPHAVADAGLRQLEKNLAEAAYEQKLDVTTGLPATEDTEPGNVVGAGHHVSRLFLAEGEGVEDSARRHIMEWADYSEGRKASLSNVITEQADLARVWDREKDKAEASEMAYDVRLDSRYGDMRAKAAELPEGPLGYEHTENCTFRDESGEDSCNAEFLQGCAFDNIQDKGGQAQDICEWALDKAGGDSDSGNGSFNCSDYGALFEDNGAGINNYFDRLTQERSGDSAAVEAELDGHLLDQRGFEAGRRGGDNVCLYREREGGDCDAEFRDQCARVDVGNGDWRYLMNGSAEYPETRLVHAKARLAFGGAVEIAGDLRTTVNSDDSQYVEIVDAYGGNLSYVRDETAPQAQLKTDAREKLKRYDGLAKDLENSQSAGISQSDKIENLEDRLASIVTDCEDPYIQCTTYLCTSEADGSCAAGTDDTVTAVLTDDAQSMLKEYKDLSQQVFTCGVAPSGAPIRCDVNGDTATASLQSGYTAIQTQEFDNLQARPDINSSGWYKVDGNRNAEALGSGNANDLMGTTGMTFDPETKKFYCNDNDSGGNDAGGNDSECQKYEIANQEAGKLQFVDSGDIKVPKPTGEYGLYKVENVTSPSTISPGADAYTLENGTFTKGKTAAACDNTQIGCSEYNDKFIYVSNAIYDNSFNNDKRKNNDPYKMTLKEAMDYCGRFPNFCDAFSWEAGKDPNVKNDVYFKRNVPKMSVKIEGGKLKGADPNNDFETWGTYNKIVNLSFAPESTETAEEGTQCPDAATFCGDGTNLVNGKCEPDFGVNVIDAGDKDTPNQGDSVLVMEINTGNVYRSTMASDTSISLVEGMPPGGMTSGKIFNTKVQGYNQGIKVGDEFFYSQTDNNQSKKYGPFVILSVFSCPTTESSCPKIESSCPKIESLPSCGDGTVVVNNECVPFLRFDPANKYRTYPHVHGSSWIHSRSRLSDPVGYAGDKDKHDKDHIKSYVELNLDGQKFNVAGVILRKAGDQGRDVNQYPEDVSVHVNYGKHQKTSSFSLASQVEDTIMLENVVSTDRIRVTINTYENHPSMRVGLLVVPGETENETVEELRDKIIPKYESEGCAWNEMYDFRTEKCQVMSFQMRKFEFYPDLVKQTVVQIKPSGSNNLFLSATKSGVSTNRLGILTDANSERTRIRLFSRGDGWSMRFEKVGYGTTYRFVQAEGHNLSNSLTATDTAIYLLRRMEGDGDFLIAAQVDGDTVFRVLRHNRNQSATSDIRWEDTTTSDINSLMNMEYFTTRNKYWWEMVP